VCFCECVSTCVSLSLSPSLCVCLKESVSVCVCLGIVSFPPSSLFVCVSLCVSLCVRLRVYQHTHTQNHTHKVRAGEPVRNALRLMLEHEISGIPVLNDQGVLLDMYCDSGMRWCVLRQMHVSSSSYDTCTVTQTFSSSQIWI
jgi:hypothetical protein